MIVSLFKNVYNWCFPEQNNIFSGQYVGNFANELSGSGWRQTLMISHSDFLRYKKITLIPSFVLKTVPLPNLIECTRLINRKAVDHYASLKTDFPPIVLSDDGTLLDGLHRTHAARTVCQKEIQAYVPLGFNGPYLF